MTEQDKTLHIIRSHASPGIQDSAPWPTMVYSHIPKCGGNSFARIIRAVVSYRNLSILSLSGSQRNYTDERGLRNDVERQDLNLSDFNVIYGHIPFSSIQSILPEARYVTLLRDPVERLI